MKSPTIYCFEDSVSAQALIPPEYSKFQVLLDKIHFLPGPARPAQALRFAMFAFQFADPVSC
jgi:hypothetical protein